MARPSKNNIGSFPFDVDFFDSKIMVRIAGEYGVKGEIIVIKLLCAVYKEGYFIKWSIDERALMIRYLPGISPDLLDQVIERLLKWDFFEEGLFRSARILTSVEIQRTYFNAIKRRTGINRSSLPFLLLDPEHPNDVSSYKNGISVTSNGISVNDYSDNVSENEIHVIKNASYGNKKEFREETDQNVSDAEKEFLYTKTGVSVYNNSNKGNKNPSNGNNNPQNGNKNPLEDHFETQTDFLRTGTGVSVDNNQGFCIQKPKGGKNNNSGSVSNNGDNVDNNLVTVGNNGEKGNNNSIADSNNPANIIYNNDNISISSRSSSSNKNCDKKTDFEEQKGKESYQEFDKALTRLKHKQQWRESICMNHRISQSELDMLIDSYSLHCKSEGKTDHSTEQALMSHFNRWIPYGKNKTQNQSKHQDHGTDATKTTSRNQRRRTDIQAERTENYHTTF